MPAFDLNNLYFIKNNAPKTTSFDDVMGAQATGFNLGKSAKEQYDKNSLQALIAQREQEGVPYYMLGNESAKWDVGTAQSMDKDRMDRIKFDYAMRKDEFENWRKNMARRICGRILQLANQMKMPSDKLADVLEVAYSYVVTYDPDLANQLLARANAIRSTTARANKPSKIEDESKLYASEIQNRQKLAKDSEGSSYEEMFWAKATADIGTRLSQLFTDGELPFLKKAWMDGVYNYGIKRGLSTKERWNADTIDSLIDEFLRKQYNNSSNTNGDTETETETETPEVGTEGGDVPQPSNGGKSVGGKAPAKKEAPYGTITSYYYPADKYKNIRENLSKAKFEADKKRYWDDKEMLNNMVTQLSNDGQRFAGAKTEGGGNTIPGVVKEYIEQVKNRIKQIEELEKGGVSPKSAKILKLNGKSATEANSARAEWGRIANLPKLYYTNPGAILPAMQRSLLPEERTTDQDVMRTVLSGAGIDDSIASEVVNAYASANNDTFANMMKKEAYKSAARALAPFILDKLINKYKTLVKMTGNEKDVDEALQETYEMSDEVLKYLKGEKILYTDKAKYETKAKEILKEQKDKEQDAWDKEHGKTNERNYTDEDWD